MPGLSVTVQKDSQRLKVAVRACVQFPKGSQAAGLRARLWEWAELTFNKQISAIDSALILRMLRPKLFEELVKQNGRAAVVHG